jgi:hypothetical protein
MIGYRTRRRVCGADYRLLQDIQNRFQEKPKK